MRTTALSLAVSLAFGFPTVLAQQTSESIGLGSPPAVPAPSSAGVSLVGAAPELGGPLLPGRDTGLDTVAEDGISTKTIRAVPCSIAARETDGTTTCVGIPDQGRTPKRR
jgi:hypothetical protein